MNDIKYETNFSAWLDKQISLLRQKKFDQLDIVHLLEEIEDLGKSDQKEIGSMWMRTLQHMLKWTYQPNNRSESWHDTILLCSEDARSAYKKNPGFKQYLSGLFDKAYKHARLKAADDTGIELKIFPEKCDWSVEQLLSPASAVRSCSESEP